MNTGIIIVFICVGLPIISGTIVSLKKLEQKKNREMDQETLDKMYFALKDLKKRIINLETILYDRDKRS